MVLPEVPFKLAAALVGAYFGAVVLLAGPRRATHRALALFLFLIAANQVADVVRAVAANMGNHGTALAAFRVSTVFAALDPFALFYFASVYPARNALHRRRWLWAALAPALLLAVWAPWHLPSFGPVESSRSADAASLALAWFTAAVYGIVLVWLVRPLLGGRDDPPGRLLLFAQALVTIPAWARTGDISSGLGRFLLRATTYDALLQYLWLFPMGLAAGGLVLLGLRAPGPRARAWIWIGAGLGTLLTFGAYASMFAYESVRPFMLAAGTPPWIIQLERVAAAVRWILFALCVSVAVVRFDILGMRLTHRRWAARGLVSLAFLLATALLLGAVNASLGRPALSFTPPELAVLAAALLLSQGFRRLVDGAAVLAYGIPARPDLATALETYRAALVQADAEGRSASADDRLARLRAELGLNRHAASVLERMAEAGSSGPLSPGQLVAGRYRVRRLLARGGSGRAFLAGDELLQREVVLKEVLMESEGQGQAALAEARAAGASRHPNVVTVFDVVRRPGAVLIVTEYLSGGSLAERLEHVGPFEVGPALSLADGILAGLEAVHVRGIIHRDLKPSNVLLDADGTPKIGDFGIARFRRGVTVGFGEPDAVLGTPEFMAPEQRAGEIATPATDVYAVGLLLRRCAAGPYPAAVERVVARALEEAPERRWPDAAAMRAALRGARSP